MDIPKASENQDHIPIFPLDVVLLPGLVMPLHIFEERYKSMIGECMEQDKPFGIFYIDDLPEPVTEQDKALIQKTVGLMSRIDELPGIIGDDNPFDFIDMDRLSFMVPETEGFTMPERQRFLEMTSARERLTKGLEVLEKVLARAKISDEVTKIIGGNGHLKALLAEKGQIY